jgi:DHA1 family bicyclomycin/chloramphenicol resistance-like MFS transporter
MRTPWRPRRFAGPAEAMTQETSATPLPARVVLLLGAMIGLGPLSIDMYLPSFPTIEREFGAVSGSLQLTLATYFVGLAVGQAFYGPISDRFGRKPPLYVGLLLFLLAALGCATSTSVAQLATFRLLQGLGGCAAMVITMAIVRDCATGAAAAKLFSRLILVMGIAPIVAPLAGGWLLTHFGWRALFFLLAAAGTLALAGVHFLLKETRNPAHVVPLSVPSVLRSYGQLLTDRSFVGYALVGATAITGMFAYIAGSPFVLIEIYGVKAQDFGWFFGANAAGFILGSQVNGRLVGRFGATRVLHRAVMMPAAAGLFLAALAYAGWLPLPLLSVGFFAYVGSLGYINPNSMALALAKQGHRAGTASALSGSAQFVFATLVGVIMSAWHDGTAWPLACVMAACGLASLLSERILTAPFRAPAASAT